LQALAASGQRIAGGPVGGVLTKPQLEALYGTPVETLSDTKSGQTAFLPG
jgi:hypothetical protein